MARETCAALRSRKQWKESLSGCPLCADLRVVLKHLLNKKWYISTQWNTPAINIQPAKMLQTNNWLQIHWGIDTAIRWETSLWRPNPSRLKASYAAGWTRDMMSETTAFTGLLTNNWLQIHLGRNNSAKRWATTIWRPDPSALKASYAPGWIRDLMSETKASSRSS
jgi:hypothetical protein